MASGDVMESLYCVLEKDSSSGAMLTSTASDEKPRPRCMDDMCVSLNLLLCRSGEGAFPSTGKGMSEK